MLLDSLASIAESLPRPSFIRPWFVAIVYLVLVSLTLCVWRRDGLRRPGGMWLWPGLMVLFAVLGVGKVVDAQGALTDLLRQGAIQDEWYRFRRPVQIGVVASLAAGMALGAFAICRLAMSGKPRRDRAVLASVVLLLGFYAVRGASWHPVDAFLFRFVAGSRINTWTELAILGLIAAALLGCVRREWDEGVPAEKRDEARDVESTDDPGPVSV